MNITYFNQDEHFNNEKSEIEKKYKFGKTFNIPLSIAHLKKFNWPSQIVIL